MINIDYEYSFVKKDNLLKYETRINKIIDKYENNDNVETSFIGWKDYAPNIEKNLIEQIKSDAQKIRKQSTILVVCGIGGSYLGARAVIEAICGGYNEDFKIIYLGNTFDERYLKETLEYIREKDFSVNVISKSGKTLETAATFRLLKRILEEKYGNLAKERIFITTDETKGFLRKLVDEEGYSSYSIPSNIGGRYSVITPVGLLPIACAGINIDDFVNGFVKATCDFKNKSLMDNPAYQYAAFRYFQYKKNKKVELLVSYTPKCLMISEWWKQLFGESEGKENKGLYPSSAIFSTDLHSLGQFIQQGSKIEFITQIKLRNKGEVKIGESKNNFDFLDYLKEKTFEDLNQAAQKGTSIAHSQIGKINVIGIEVGELNTFNVGYLMYFFMFSCMISARLLGVNPFDQPGVEYYKTKMNELLK